MPLPIIRATTILAVRRNGRVAIGGDGQVSVGDTIAKSQAVKNLAVPVRFRISPQSPGAATTVTGEVWIAFCSFGLA